MTYALCSDLHAHAWSQFSFLTSEGINSRLSHLMSELSHMAKTAHEKGCKRVYVAGDIFHVRGQVKPSVLNPMAATLRNLARAYELTWRLMPGNHDLEGVDTQWLGSAIEALSQVEGVEVISDCKVFHDDKVVMVPWFKLHEQLDSQIRYMKSVVESTEDYDLILHTGIDGVLIGLSQGWTPKQLADYGFKRVFAGHYHNHKVFTLPQSEFQDTKIVSIGSLTHQTWSDVNTLAGWMIVGESDFSFHENRQPKFMDFDPSKDIESYIGNYVRVQGIELEEQEIREFREGLLEAGVAGVVVHAIAKSKVVTRAGVAAKSAVTMERSIADWIKSAGMKNPESVERAALDILNKARSIA